MNKISKILLLVLMVFIAVPNLVFAEEYKSGDIVELINPTGEESLKFYIEPISVDGINYYNLYSVEPIIKEKTLKEIDNLFEQDILNYVPKIKYVYDYYEEGKLGVDILSSVYSCIGEEYDWENKPESYYFNCPVYKDKYDNIHMGTVTTTGNQGSVENVEFYSILKSDNPSYDYVFKYKKFDSESDFYDSYEYNIFKGNYFMSVEIEEANLDMIRKVKIEEPKVEENATKEETTTTTTQKEEVKDVKNPSTGDVNIVFVMLGLVSFAGLALVANKKVRKIKNN